MRKILVLRGGALGDFIVTLPALAALRRRWPEARIELAGNATAAALARTRGLLDAVHSQHEARWAALYGDAPLAPAFAAWLGEFDLVLSFWPDPDGDLRRRFPLRAGQRFLHGDALPTRAPAAAHYAAPLRELGIGTTDLHYTLATPPVDRSDAARPIALHPGSGSPRKNWPAENWRALIARLDAPVSLIVGEAERAAWADFAAPRVTVLHAPPLEDLAAHLAGCRHFLGHDSGIGHLAAACGVPCTLLFGPTDPAMWAPPAPHVRVLRRGDALAAITVDDVLAALAAPAGP